MLYHVRRSLVRLRKVIPGSVVLGPISSSYVRLGKVRPYLAMILLIRPG
jgi:hypothetical protein